jgi:hypothetical protein
VKTIESCQSKQQVAEVSSGDPLDLVSPVVRGRIVNCDTGADCQRAKREANEQHRKEIEISDVTLGSERTNKYADKDRHVDEVVRDDIEPRTGGGLMKLQTGAFTVDAIQSDGQKEEQRSS